MWDSFIPTALALIWDDVPDEARVVALLIGLNAAQELALP